MGKSVSLTKQMSPVAIQEKKQAELKDLIDKKVKFQQEHYKALEEIKTAKKSGVSVKGSAITEAMRLSKDRLSMVLEDSKSRDMLQNEEDIKDTVKKLREDLNIVQMVISQKEAERLDKVKEERKARLEELNKQHDLIDDDVEAFEKVDVETVSKDTLEQRFKSISKFKSNNLIFGNDEEFTKNFAKNSLLIEQQIYNADAVKELYYKKTKISAKEEDQILQQMAKGVALRELKKFFELRERLITNPYYQIIEDVDINQVDSDTLGDFAFLKEQSNEFVIAEYLALVAAMREIKVQSVEDYDAYQKKVYTENKENWKYLRDSYLEWTKINTGIDKLVNEDNESERIKQAKKAERSAAEDKAKTEKEQQDKLLTEPQYEEIDLQIDEWIRDGYATSEEAGYWVLADFRDIVRDSLAKKIFDKNLDINDKNAIFRALTLFNNNLKTNIRYIDNKLSTAEWTSVAAGLTSNKEIIKKKLLKKLKADALASKGAVNLFKNTEFMDIFKFSQIKAHREAFDRYHKLISLFPGLETDKEFLQALNLDANESILLDEERFEETYEILKNQKEYNLKAVGFYINAAIEENKLPAVLRQRFYNQVLYTLKSKVIFLSVDELHAKIQNYIDNRSQLHLDAIKLDNQYNLTELTDEQKQFIKNDDTNSFALVTLCGPLFLKNPEHLGEFNDIANEKDPELLLSMIKANKDVLERYPQVAKFKTLGETETLGQREFFDIVRMLNSGLYVYWGAYRTLASKKEINVKKQALKLIAADELTPENIKKFEKEEAAKEAQKAKIAEMGRERLLSRIGSGVFLSDEVTYDYTKVKGDNVWFQSIFGIRARQSEFKVPARIARVKKAKQLWDTLYARGKALEVMKWLNTNSDASKLGKYLESIGIKTEENPKAIYHELLMAGNAASMLSTNGLAANALLQYSKKDYEKEILKNKFVLNRSIAVEEFIKFLLLNTANKMSVSKVNQIRNFMRPLVAGMKSVEHEFPWEVEEAKKYNFEHFGVETFEEAFDLIKAKVDFKTNTITTPQAVQVKENIESIKQYKDGLFAPILNQLLQKENIYKDLSESNKFHFGLYLRNVLEVKYGPLLRAIDRVKKNDVYNDYLINQYIVNHFDQIDAECGKKDVGDSVKYWQKHITSYINTVLEHKIEGQVSLSDRIQDAIKYVGKLRKEKEPAINGSFFLNMMKLHPELWDVLINDRDNFESSIKVIVEADNKETDETKKIVNVNVVQVADISDAERQALEARQNAREKARDDVRRTKMLGIMHDTDLKKIRALNNTRLKYPGIYLATNKINKISAGTDTDATDAISFTAETSATYLEKVNSALKTMRHENELSDNLKKFMCEVLFANKYSNINNELRYLIAVYNYVSDHYRYGSGMAVEVEQSKLEKATIYYYMNHVDHSIDEDGKMKYNFKENQTEEFNIDDFELVELTDTDKKLIDEEDKKVKAIQEEEKKYRDYLDTLINSGDAELIEKGKRGLAEIEDRRKAAEKAQKAKIKELKKAYKAKTKAIDFEKKHTEYLIPILELNNPAELVEFDKKIALIERVENLSLSIKDPAIAREYDDFHKAMNLAVYTYTLDDFTNLVHRRLKYLEYSNQALEFAKIAVEEHYNALAARLNAGKTDKKDLYNPESEIKYTYTGIREYLRNTILTDIKNTEGEVVRVSRTHIEDVVKEILNDEERMLFITNEYGGISSYDSVFQGRYIGDQKGVTDFDELIKGSSDEALIKKYKGLNDKEKLLFIAALSITLESEINGAGGTGTGTLLEQTPAANDTIKEVNAAIDKYINGEEFNINIDIETAMLRIKDEKASQKNFIYKGLHINKSAVLNKSAFNAAFELVKSINEVAEQAREADLNTIGNPKYILQAANKWNTKGYNELRTMNSKPIKSVRSFKDRFLSIATKDSVDLSKVNELSTASKALEATKGALIQGGGHIELTTRLRDMDDSDLKILVAVLQNRTVIDYKSSMSSRDGDYVPFANEAMRDNLIKQIASNSKSQYEALSKMTSQDALETALATLVSFQMKETAQCNGAKTDFVKGALDRKTIIDWAMLERAFNLVDEIKNESLKMQLIQKSSDFIEDSGNELAKRVYLDKKLNDSSTKINNSDFDKFIASQAQTDEQKAMLVGFNVLSDAEKSLFIRALQDRTILDVSTKNKYRSVVLGGERQYVNEAGRYELMDEFMNMTGSTFENPLELAENAYANAMRSILSTQVDDDNDFTKVDTTDVKKILVNEGKRDTAIDWKLFANALQFVTRMRDERDIVLQDSELYRIKGNLAEHGYFKYNMSYLRKNINTTTGSFAYYASTRIRERLKKVIPDTGNLRKLMGHILSTNVMNKVNKSGLLPEAGTTGEINKQYMTKIEAEKVEKDIKVYSDKAAHKKVKVEASKKEYEEAAAALAAKEALLENAKEDEKAALEAEIKELKKVEIAKHKIYDKDNAELTNYNTKVDELKKQSITLNGLEYTQVEANTAILASGKGAKVDSSTLPTKVLFYTDEFSNLDKNAFEEIQLRRQKLAEGATEDEIEQLVQAKRKEIADRIAETEALTSVEQKPTYITTRRLTTKLVNNSAVGDMVSQMQKNLGTSDIAIELVKTEEGLCKFILTMESKREYTEEELLRIDNEFKAAMISAEKSQAKNGVGLTDDDIDRVLLNNTGLSEAVAKMDTLAIICDNLKLSENVPELAGYETALLDLRKNLSELTMLIKSDKNTYEKIIDGNFNAVLNNALVFGEAVFEPETIAKIKQISQTIDTFKATSAQIVDIFMNDTNVVSNMLEVDFASIVKTFGQYGDYKSLNQLEKAVKSSQGAAAKLYKMISMYNTPNLDGTEKEFFSTDTNILEQIGVDQLFDVVQAGLGMFGDNLTTKSSTIVDKANKLTMKMGAFVTEILKEKKSIEEREKNKELKDSEKEDAHTASVGSIVKAADIKAASDFVASMIDNPKYADKFKTYGSILNSLKDEVADLFVIFNTNEETVEKMSKFNLDKLSDIGDLYGKDSNVYLVGKIISGGASILSASFKMYLKSHPIEKDEDKKDESKKKQEGVTKDTKLNEYGEVVKRKFSDQLNQYGIDDIFQFTKMLGAMDPTGTSSKYIEKAEKVKNEVASYVDKVQTYLEEKNAANLLATTDIFGAIEALRSLGTDEKDTTLAKLLKTGSDLQSDVTGIVNVITSDDHVLDSLAKLDLKGLKEIRDRYGKEGFIGVTAEYISFAKEMYDYTHGLGKQSEAFIRSFTELFKGVDGNQFTQNTAETIYKNYKDHKIIGEKITELYKAGTLQNFVMYGSLIKDNLSNVVNGVLAIRDSVKLNNGMTRGRNQTTRDDYEITRAYEQEIELITNPNLQTDAETKNLAYSSHMRNWALIESGAKYGYTIQQNKGVDLVAGVGASVSKYIDSTGLLKTTFEEAGALLKYLNTVLTDSNECKVYFTKGPGKAIYEKLSKEKANVAGADYEMNADMALRSLGISNDMEMRAYVGKQIAHSILFAASKYNPLAGIKTMANTILGILGLSELAESPLDMASEEQVYNKLVGAF